MTKGVQMEKSEELFNEAVKEKGVAMTTQGHTARVHAFIVGRDPQRAMEAVQTMVCACVR